MFRAQPPSCATAAGRAACARGRTAREAAAVGRTWGGGRGNGGDHQTTTSSTELVRGAAHSAARVILASPVRTRPRDATGWMRALHPHTACARSSGGAGALRRRASPGGPCCPRRSPRTTCCSCWDAASPKPRHSRVGPAGQISLRRVLRPRNSSGGRPSRSWSCCLLGCALWKRQPTWFQRRNSTEDLVTLTGVTPFKAHRHDSVTEVY